jgi:hypothetical protein
LTEVLESVNATVKFNKLVFVGTFFKWSKCFNFFVQASGARAQGPAADGGEPATGGQVAAAFAGSIPRCRTWTAVSSFN